MYVKTEIRSRESSFYIELQCLFQVQRVSQWLTAKENLAYDGFQQKTLLSFQLSYENTLNRLINLDVTSSEFVPQEDLQIFFCCCTRCAQDAPQTRFTSFPVSEFIQFSGYVQFKRIFFVKMWLKKLSHHVESAIKSFLLNLACVHCSIELEMNKII